ncbi:MAG: metal-dependent hydrolase, partial [Gammaproteobacteria bacterium]|nr:metal-dependent hydrolase [Gammaproteobacteria bacterium]
MDIITQGTLGCVLAQSAARPGEIRQASIIGALSGLLADADVLIRSSEDPLLTIEFHRHFTHSVFFIPFGALIAALIIWPFVKRHMDFKRL